MAQYQLSTDRVTWQDIEPDPTVVVYRPHAETVEKLDGLRRGLGFAQLEWDWGQTLMSGIRLYNLQRFCPAGQAHATVYVRSMIDEVGSAHRRTQKEFRGTMGRVRVDRHVLRSGQDWARGVGVTFDELQEQPTFVRNRGLVLTGYPGIEALAIDAAAGYLYCGLYPWPVATGQVARVSLRDMLPLDVLTLSPGGNVRTLNFGPNGEFLYIGCEESAGNDSVVKVRLSDFTQVDRVVLTLAGTIRAVAIDSNGTYGYFGLYNDPWDLCRVRLSDMTHLNTISGSYHGTNSVLIDPSDVYLYVTSGAAPFTMLTRVEVATFTVGTTVDLQLTGSIIRGVMDNAGTYIYYSTINNSPSELCQVAVSTFSSLGTLTLQSSEDDLFGLCMDEGNEYLYVGIRGSGAVPTEIVRFAVPALTRLASISFVMGEYDVRSLAFDQIRFFGYAGLQNAPGQVVEFGGGT